MTNLKVWIITFWEIIVISEVKDTADTVFAQKCNDLLCCSSCVSDLRGGLVLVLSVVGLLSSQALAMLSMFFACEVMPTVVR